MAAMATDSVEPYLTPGRAWWYSRDDLLAWGFDNDAESFRIVNKGQEIRKAQGLFLREYKDQRRLGRGNETHEELVVPDAT